MCKFYATSDNARKYVFANLDKKEYYVITKIIHFSFEIPKII